MEDSVYALILAFMNAICYDDVASELWLRCLLRLCYKEQIVWKAIGVV